MTNHWSDIANSTFVLVWGANPAENHPACVAHINRARFPKQYYLPSDTRSAKTGARMIVVDPRKTRTAMMVDEDHGDRFIRIRPGTDIAMQNAVLKYIIGEMENPTKPASTAAKAAFYSFLNQTSNGTFYTDGAATSTAVTNEAVTLTGVVASSLAHIGLASVVVKSSDLVTTYAATDYTVDTGMGTIARSAISTIPSGATVAVSYLYGGSALITNVPGCSKYTDARFLVNALGTDYQRAVINTGTERQITDFPVKATLVTDSPDTVYSRLKSHVSPYTTAVAADICGCTEADIVYLADSLIAHSRCSTGASNDPRDPAYRATTILYAMGQTQHTYGAQNIKGFANIQSLLGNMGRAGGGINALRGIHNVQGSTDMGLLFGNIPAYSSNPTVQFNPTGTHAQINAFGDYMDGLWGNPLSGSGTRAKMDSSYDDAYNTTASALGAMALQQRGFFNMTLKWFGGYAAALAASGAARRAIVDSAYSLWPKGNGDDHVSMFRAMGATTTKALIAWGQNPAVSEPNQGAVRTGLYNLEMLVCVDMFLNETSGCDRNPSGVTYLIPTAAHVEKAGSAVNSGRTLQWRYEARKPAGNCKDDTELLLRFAKALDTANAFTHIQSVWAANPGMMPTTSVYDGLFGTPYKYTPGVNTYATVSGPAESVVVRKNVGDPLVYNGGTVTAEPHTLTGLTAQALGHTTGLMPVSAVKIGATTYSNTTDYVIDYVNGTIARRLGSTIPDGATVLVNYAYSATVSGSEWVSENVYREMNLPSANGGTIWIYTGAYNNTATTASDNKAAAQATWPTMNRAKSRDATDDSGQLHFHGWGYAWLVNRRVFYNNSDVLGDVADFFMEPDSCSHIFATNNGALLNYSRWYRHNHTLKDLPSPVLAGNTSSPHYAGNAVSLAGRFPGHTEPYETPRQDLLPSWGRNTKGTAGNYWDLVKDTTRVTGRGFVAGVGGKTVTDPPVSSFPLVLTSIRCVEHFQGGPITRNNWFNVELEPEPWVELNFVDASAAGIADGDYVRVVTARSVDDTGALAFTTHAPYGNGFRARVGVGLSSNQKVMPGVVAIPWHWGEQGLSQGSRANDLCIDSTDANSVIPEYKACLCRVEKI